MDTIVLSIEDTRSVVRHVGLDALMDEIIEGLCQAIEAYDPEDLITFDRDGFKYSRPATGLLEWMPVMRVGDKVTVKLVGYHPDNPRSQNLPTILSTISIFDTANGHMLGLIDGTLITALRTGAASAVASRLMAHPDSESLGLIGGGAHALTQLHALTRVLALRSVWIYDADPDVTAGFTRRADVLGLNGTKISAAPLEQLLESSDLICTSTSVPVGAGPVFEDNGLRPWVHVNAVGSDFPGKTELPLALLKRSVVCPDYRSQAIREGECQQLPAEEVGPSLVDLVKDPARFEYLRTTASVFDSTGWALEDHVAAEIFLRHAKRIGAGSPMQIENIGEDPRNPYHFIAQKGT